MTAPLTKTPRSFARRWLRRLTRASLFLLAAGLMLHFTVLPMIVRSRIHAALREAGIDRAKFLLRHVGLHRTELADMALGEPNWLRVATIDVDYHIGSLWKGRVTSIKVNGVEWPMHISRDGRVDAGPLLKVSPNGRVNGSQDIPLDRIDVKDAVLLIDWNGTESRVPLSLSIVRSVDGSFSVKVDAVPIELANGEVRVAADRIAVQATIDLRAPSDVLRTGQVVIENASMQAPSAGLAIDSASADVTFDSLSPLSTPPNQTITIRKGRFGVLEVIDAGVEFELIDPDHIAIQSASWNLGDMGRFQASPFDLDLTKPVIRTTVSGKAIHLSPWLALLTGDRVRGEGELEGLLTMKIRPTSKFAIELGEGVLEAVPAAGFIQIRDQETVNNLVSRMDLGGDDTLTQVRDRIVAAVQDFKFTAFSVEFLPENDEVNCRIETKGVGRTGQNPQEIGGAVVNIHHFDDILRAVIRGKSLYDQVE